MPEEQEPVPVSANSKTILWVLIVIIFVGGFIFAVSRNVEKNQLSSSAVSSTDTIETNDKQHKINLASLEGTWTGSAYQDDIKQNFDLKLTCEKGKYTIEYPSIGCGGAWQVTESTSDKVVFVEQLSYGQDICNNGGTVVINFEGKDKLKFQYYYPNLDTLNAVGVLRKM